MTLTRGLAICGFVVVAAAVVGGILLIGLQRRSTAPPGSVALSPPSEPPAQGRKIKAQLFYLSDDGARLMSVERDVPFAESTAEQAKAIINVQIAPSGETLSAVPAGTTLRALFVTPQGEAYVDLSGEISTAHPGGSMAELLTVYTIVDALTMNLPAIKAVQLLVGGKEVDTLAGHVDLRRPLAKNTTWMAEP